MRNFIVTIDGKQYQVGVEEVGATASTTPVVTEIKSAPVAAAPAAAPAPAAKPAAAGPVNGTKVNAPMPGTILDVKVSNGQAVKKGDVICVLEAMKMENDIPAPCDGVIASVNVQKGASVNAGDLVASIN